MKKIICLLLFICTSSALCAQNNAAEAKMAYQLAEENFETKEYKNALDYLDRAEKSLGKKNPPMAYLRVMITNERIQAINVSDNEAFMQLQKVLDDFENLKNKGALGEDKLMEIYRVKIEQEKRQAKIKQDLERKKELEARLPYIINDALGDLPSTGVPIEEVLDNKYMDVIKDFGVGNGFKRKIRKHGTFVSPSYTSPRSYALYRSKTTGDKAITSIFSNSERFVTSYNFDFILGDEKVKDYLSLNEILTVLSLYEVKEYLSITNEEYYYYVSFINNESSYKLKINHIVYDNNLVNGYGKKFPGNYYLEIEVLEAQHSK